MTLTDAERAQLADAFRKSSRSPDHLAFLAAPVVERIIRDRAQRSAPAIDRCPSCDRPVPSVEGDERGVYRANPCGHVVVPTMWPDRIALDNPHAE